MKTLPSSSASFVQMKVSSSSMRERALAALQRAPRSVHLDFIALAIQGRKIGFEKVIAMIDDLVAELKVEQTDDDDKKEYCQHQFDESDDKKKSLERSISDLEKAIADSEEGIAATKDEIKALTKSIAALDKSVAEATEQRKEENEEFTELMANDSAAKELLQFAINRLNKFYSPKLYKAPPKRELSEEEAIYAANGGEVDAAPALFQRAARRDAPAPP